MKNLILFLFTWAFATGLHSQPSFYKFLPVAGKGGSLYRSIPTSDGGLVSVGGIFDYTTFDGDFLITKTDAAGNVAWIKSCFTVDFEEFTDVAEVAGGALAAAGSALDMGTFLSKAVVRKFSPTGANEWTKLYSVGGHSAGAEKIAGDDLGNLYVLGTVAVDGASDDYFIMKLDAGGNILSQATYGTPDHDYPLAFLRNGNGDFFICGWHNTLIGENIHLLKINSDMSLAWNKKISGTVRHFGYDMKERSDGDLVLAGRYDDGGSSYDILVCTLDDASGDQVWAKSYSAVDDFGVYAHGITIAPGDEIAITGPAETADPQAFLVETDAAGNLNWSYKYGEPGSTGEGYGVTRSSDGGYLVCGPLTNSDDAIVQLLKTGSNGSLACNMSDMELTVSPVTLPMNTITVTTGTTSLTAQEVTLNELSFSSLTTICLGTGVRKVSESEVSVGPNPSDGRFTVSAPATFAGTPVTVVDEAGREFMKDNLPSGDGGTSISKAFSIKASPGAYVVRIGSGIRQVVHKLLIY